MTSPFPFLRAAGPRSRSFPTLLSRHQTRADSANAAKYKRADDSGSASKRKKKTSTAFTLPNLKLVDQFALCDAIRYIRAAEVGREYSKYELHVRLRTPKNGPVVRNRMRLPHTVSNPVNTAVICPPESKQAQAAKANGATMVGEENIFNAIKEGRIEFDRCICHVDSQKRLAQTGLARILGPRGLMPSPKTGTVVKDVGSVLRDLHGSSEYRERIGVVHMVVGRIGFTAEELARNISAFMQALKKDCAALSDQVTKEVHEVVSLEIPF